MIVLLNETGVYSAPALYGPAGGVTGRVTFGLVIWLVAWAILHPLLRKRRGGHAAVYSLSILLIILGILATFPPLWGLFGE